MLDYMLNFSNISYVRCLHVSLIINTFAAVVGLYIRDRTFFFPHFYCAFILLSYLWESIFNFSFMKKYFPIPLIIILWIGLSLWSCNQPLSQKEKSSATFDSIHVEKTYHLLENPEYPNCNLVLQFTYPTACENEAILPLVQKQFIVTFFGDEYEQLTPQEAINHYTEDYLANYKELEETFRKDLEANEKPGAWYSYYEMASNAIEYNKNNFVSYTVSFENYTGGAHGSHSFTNFTIDMNTGKRITEEDLFTEEYQDTLAGLLVAEIAKKNNITDSKDLENIGYFSVDEIYPNNNFYIDDTGITYTFNEYEIAAYALGATEVHLTFDQIKMLLKEGNPIAGRITY